MADDTPPRLPVQLTASERKALATAATRKRRSEGNLAAFYVVESLKRDGFLNDENVPADAPTRGKE